MCLVNTSLFHIKIIDSINLKMERKKYLEMNLTYVLNLTKVSFLFKW